MRDIFFVKLNIDFFCLHYISCRMLRKTTIYIFIKKINSGFEKHILKKESNEITVQGDAGCPN